MDYLIGLESLILDIFACSYQAYVIHLFAKSIGVTSPIALNSFFAKQNTLNAVVSKLLQLFHSYEKRFH